MAPRDDKPPARRRRSPKKRAERAGTAQASTPRPKDEPGAARGTRKPETKRLARQPGAAAKWVRGPGEPAKPAPAPTEQERDRLYVYRPCESGDGYQVLRHREDRVEVGEIRELREGRPITGEVVQLSPVKDQERLFDVAVLLECPKKPRHAGPAMVSSDRYRRGWDAIFGAKEKRRGSDSSELN